MVTLELVPLNTRALLYFPDAVHAAVGDRTSGPLLVDAGAERLRVDAPAGRPGEARAIVLGFPILHELVGHRRGDVHAELDLRREVVGAVEDLLGDWMS